MSDPVSDVPLSEPVVDKKKAQLDRLKELRKRKAESAQSNRKAVHQEYSKVHTDPKQVQKLEQMKERAELELLRMEAGDEEQFERKRAWDWTVEESEKWDDKLRAKQEIKDGAHFTDHAKAAERTYLKEMRELKPDLAAYERGKREALQRSATLVETEEGDVILIKQPASSSAGEGRLHKKPSKQAVDRLVDKLKKDDTRRQKRRRTDEQEDDHVTYINEKNKQFNKKLSRHYDKYTKEIRDSFERGTAL